MKGMLGRKIGMSRLFDEKGGSISVTLLESGPCPIVQKKKADKDGYIAIQIGFDSVKEKKASKAHVGHCKKTVGGAVRVLKEFEYQNMEDMKEGENVTVEIFSDVKSVDVTGISKGKGFAGTIKRHNFHRGKETHGNKNHRAPGSIGGHSYPARVWPGQKLPGHYGSKRTTAKNLSVLLVDSEKNLLIVKGAVPGPNGGYLTIKESTHAGKR